MFSNASSFNQPIRNWDTSVVTSMQGVFSSSSSFNQPIGDWNVSSVTSMRWMFKGASTFNQPLTNWEMSSVTRTDQIFQNATSYNQDVSKWNLSGDLNMTDMFDNTSDLSNSNKILIHSTFSTNSNWPYDWSTFVTEQYQSPNGDYQTPESNYSSPHSGYELPSGHFQSPDSNYQSPTDYYKPNLDINQTLVDQNNSTTSKPTQVYIPIVKTFPAVHDGNGTYHMSGEVLTDGGSAPTEVGIMVSEDILFFDPIRISARAVPNFEDFHFSYSNLIPNTTYYFKAYAINAAGENWGSVKKFRTDPETDSTSWYKDAEALPGGWKESDWLGVFQPTDHQWIYHSELGWLYPSPMPDGSLWLWNEADGWRWTQQGVYPYLFRWRDSAWIYLQGQINGRIFYYNYSIKSYE